MTRAGLGFLGVSGGSDDTYRWWAQGGLYPGKSCSLPVSPQGSPSTHCFEAGFGPVASDNQSALGRVILPEACGVPVK